MKVSDKCINKYKRENGILTEAQERTGLYS